MDRKVIEWHNGVPPEIGWYPVSFSPRDNKLLNYRWWNGSVWSVSAQKNYSSELAAESAEIPMSKSSSVAVFWSKQWWKE